MKRFGQDSRNDAWAREEMVQEQLVSRGVKDAQMLQVIGGRLVMPVGGEESQVLKRVRRKPSRFKDEDLGACRFVKLLGRYGWPD